MRRPGGWLCERLTDADGRERVTEHDTFTCAHCNRLVVVRSGQRPDDLGGFCYGCSKMVCPACVGRGCDTIEEKLRRAEASYHARRSYGFG